MHEHAAAATMWYHFAHVVCIGPVIVSIVRLCLEWVEIKKLQQLLINSITRKRCELWVRRKKNHFTLNTYLECMEVATTTKLSTSERSRRMNTQKKLLQVLLLRDLQLIFRVSFSQNHYHWMGIVALVFVVCSPFPIFIFVWCLGKIEIRWLHEKYLREEKFQVSRSRSPSSDSKNFFLVLLNVCFVCVLLTFADQND